VKFVFQTSIYLHGAEYLKISQYFPQIVKKIHPFSLQRSQEPATSYHESDESNLSLMFLWDPFKYFPIYAKFFKMIIPFRFLLPNFCMHKNVKTRSTTWMLFSTL